MKKLVIKDTPGKIKQVLNQFVTSDFNNKQGSAIYAFVKHLGVDINFVPPKKEGKTEVFELADDSPLLEMYATAMDCTPVKSMHFEWFKKTFVLQ